MKKTSIGRTANARAILLASAAVACLAAPHTALAQDEADQAASADGDPFSVQEDSATGNEIIVTATKREQTLQDTPVAVSVATAEAIDRAAIRDLKDLSTIVPSLRVTQLQSSANTNFIIRGFGNGANNAGIEPSVGVFVDGVYRSRTASQINDLPNITRVEVLRGPQSTLFGKNASAGVISIVTEEPRFDFGGSVEASYGNYDAVVLRGYVTGPVSESVALSVAGGLNKRDGYVRDLGTGDRTNERDRYFVRGQVLIEPSSNFRARFIADYDSLDENCCGVVNLQPSLPPQLGGPPGGGATIVIQQLGGQVNAPDEIYDDIVYSNINSTNDIRNWGISGQFDLDVGGVTLTSISAYRNNNAVTFQDPDFTSADLINPIAADVDIDTFTQELRLNTDIGDRAHLLLGAFYIKEDVEQTGAVLWGTQARAYAQALVASLSGCPAAPTCIPNMLTLEGTLGTLEGNPAKYLNQFFQTGDGNDERFSMDSEAFSFFGQVDFEITDGLTLTLGGNYTKDTKDYAAAIDSTDVFSSVDLVADGNTLLFVQGLQMAGVNPNDPAAVFAFATDPGTAPIYQGIVAFANANDDNPAVNPLLALRPLQFLPPFLAVPNAVEDGHVSDDDFSYTVRLSYDVNDTINVYASYATGFKAASVNLSRDSRPLFADQDAIEDAGIDEVNQTYGTRFADPEESTVYEVGFKGNWGTAAANIAVFQQEIKGFQSNVFTGTGFALANAGKQSTFGVEFEGQVEPVEGLLFNLGVTYLDPQYDDFEFSAVGNLSGTRPGGIPTWTVVLGGQYEHEFGNGDSLVLNGSYHFESDVAINEGLPGFAVRGPDGNVIDPQPALDAAEPFRRQVDEVQASLTYAMDNGLEFQIWGRNLLDDRYILQIFDSVAQPFSISGYTNQPRTYGGTVRFRW
jgi:iron complex outermembrane receptor protein